jgi:hypothetical protein
MNKKIIGVILVACILMLAGCGKVKYPDLPDNPIAFEMGSFEDTEHDEALFGTLEYNGRTYIGFGTISNAYKQSDLDQCIGYIVMDKNSSSVPDPNNTDTRVYTLAGDDHHNFLMDYDGIGEMNQPNIWRAVDTKGKDIEIPAFIDDLGYEFWK